MSTLHDRITALADEWTEQARRARAGDYGSRVADEANTLDNAAHRLRAVLAETATAQPEADAVERATPTKEQYDRARLSLAIMAGKTVEVGTTLHSDLVYDAETVRLYEAAQPVVHGLLPGSHERPAGPECRCGSSWDAWSGRCAAQPVEPEPDEREARSAATVEDHYLRGGQTSAEWARGADRDVLGVLTNDLLLTANGLGYWTMADAILAAGFRRSRPEATHTVTAGEVRTAAALVATRDGAGREVVLVNRLDVFLATLGVTVADTPERAGDDA